jgi:hypothetical protein
VGIFDDLFARDLLAGDIPVRRQPAPVPAPPMPVMPAMAAPPPLMSDLLRSEKPAPSEINTLLKQAAGIVEDYKNPKPKGGTPRASDMIWQLPASATDYYATFNQNDQPGLPGPRMLNPLEVPEGSSGDLGSFDSSSVPAAYLKKTRAFESANNPKARNPGSGASGSYQFLPSTWKSLMEEAP